MPALLQGEPLVARSQATTTTVAVAAPPVLVLPVGDEAVPHDPRPLPRGLRSLTPIAVVGVTLRRGLGDVGLGIPGAPQGVDAPRRDASPARAVGPTNRQVRRRGGARVAPRRVLRSVERSAGQEVPMPTPVPSGQACLPRIAASRFDRDQIGSGRRELVNAGVERVPNPRIHISPLWSSF